MPTYRATNAGLQTKGALWAGFDPATSAVMAGVFLVSVMVTFASISALKLSWVVAVGLFFLVPNGLMLAVVFGLVMGKPPKYVRDWAESRLLGKTRLNLEGMAEPPAWEEAP